MAERIEGWLSRFPGYDGYRDKENRRDDDWQVRETIANSLQGIVDQLTTANARLADSRQLTYISQIESLVSRTRLLEDRVRTASYGYGGIFTDREIDEFALDQLRQFDLAFQKNVGALETISQRVGAETTPLETDLAAFEEQLTSLSKLFDARGGVVDTARPNRDAEVLALLEPQEAPTPSPLHGLRVGETLSILGDNLQVDALIQVNGANTTFTLARVDEASSTWVLGASDQSFPSAKVIEDRNASSLLDAALQPAKITVTSGIESAKAVAGAYAAQTGDDNSVRFDLQVGDAHRQFNGERVNDLDVEVYGSAS